MNKIDDTNDVGFTKDAGILRVLDGCWNSLENQQPIVWNDETERITLAEIEEQYGKYGVVIVVFESYLCGDIYRLGNYSDGKWYKIGDLYGFA